MYLPSTLFTWAFLITATVQACLIIAIEAYALVDSDSEVEDANEYTDTSLQSFKAVLQDINRHPNHKLFLHTCRYSYSDSCIRQS